MASMVSLLPRLFPPTRITRSLLEKGLDTAFNCWERQR